ncbi:MAG: hypothetical protein GWP14_08540 [Actinobacteria bacterium]|nr:hypothetical protein [Actinomycetota bacterium]
MAIDVSNGEIVIDGQSHLLFSGEVHYWRLEKRYWRPILQRLKDTGMKWVGLYVPWRVHDQGVHDYDFVGRSDEQLNLQGFLELIHQMELLAFFRPGPLIVSEMRHGGYPDWLALSGPEYMVWTARGEVPPGFGGDGRCPSYLHPKYLEHCRRYLTEVNKIAYPFLHQNGGPIKLIQLDNEVSLVCRDAMFESDYNPHVIGPGGEYHRWLENKYRSVKNIPYGQDKKAIEEIEPPRNLSEFCESTIRWYFDWAEFKEFILAEYIRRIKQIHLDCGVKDILFGTNLNPHRPNSMPNNWNEYRKACDGENPGIVGYDFYRNPFLSRTGYGSLARISRMFNSYFSLPWSAEFMSGFWREDYTKHPYPYAEHHEFMADAAIAHGLRGISWYMFHDRESWGGSPVSAKAQTRYAYRAICDIMDFVNGAEAFGSLKEEKEVAVLSYRPYHRHTYLGDPMPAADDTLTLGNPEIDNIPAGRSSREFEGMFPLLADAGYHPAAVDMDINPDDLGTYGAVFATTQTFMDADTQKLLVEYARVGGTLFVGPAIPVKDLDLQPLSILGELVSSELVGKLGSDTLLATSLGQVAVEGEWYNVSGDPLVTDLSGRILATETTIGNGRIVTFAGYLAQRDDPGSLADNNTLIRGLLERFGILPYAKADAKKVEVVVLSDGNETYVYLLNHDTVTRTVTVCFRDDTRGKLMDLRSDEVIEIVDDSFAADVDVKRARLFRKCE